MSDDLRINAERKENPVAKYFDGYKKIIEDIDRQYNVDGAVQANVRPKMNSIFENGFASGNTQNA